MACHELAALRLGLMNVIGIEDEGERAHELAELGEALENTGPLSSLVEAGSLQELRRCYEVALGDLAQKVAALDADDPQIPYYKSLLVTTKKVELDLAGYTESLQRFWCDLEEVHDFLHETFPQEG